MGTDGTVMTGIKGRQVVWYYRVSDGLYETAGENSAVGQ